MNEKRRLLCTRFFAFGSEWRCYLFLCYVLGKFAGLTLGWSDVTLETIQSDGWPGGRLLIDIHTHTCPRSDDSVLSPSDLIEGAKRAGLDGICLTDHDRFWDPREVTELSEAHDFLVLPGCEVTTEEGHLLVFGLSQYVFGMHRAAFVRRLLDEAGGVMVLAHPYRRAYLKDAHTGPEALADMVDRACRNPVLEAVDAIDVLNGRASPQENAFSQEIARRLGLKGIGASDAHRPSDVGTYATELFRPVRSLEDLIAEIKAGRFRPAALGKHHGALSGGARRTPEKVQSCHSQ